MTMIQAIDLSKRYANGILALDALNLSVERGEIYCLLGATGAGKTTALDLFLGFTKPTAGKVFVNGVDAVQDTLEAKRLIAYLMGDMAFYDNLTAYQNLEFFAHLSGHEKVDRDEMAMAMREVGLPERSFGVRIDSFDRGMRQKLGLAAALIKNSPALLLDEPMAGLDAQTSEELVEILGSLRDRGKAILFSTQDLFHARQLADTVGILKEGRKVLSFSREELRYQNLEEIYLNYMRGGLGSRSQDGTNPWA